VWGEARALVKLVYDETNRFPKSEMFGLTSQLNRAVVSVACNLAEGSARTSAKDQAHFSQLAYSSLMEVLCLIVICEDTRLLQSSTTEQLRVKVQELAAGINALRNSQLNSSTPKPNAV